MAFPFAFLPVIKLIALGSVKIVFLFLGALFFPVYCLRLILGGASGMILPVLGLLYEKDKIDTRLYHETVEQLVALEKVEISRAEARGVLFSLIAKTARGIKEGVLGLPSAITRMVGQLFGK